MLKLWVDDLRPPPDDTWIHCETSSSAIWLLKYARQGGSVVAEMSLDHDLGGDDTTRPIVMWMCEREYWPLQVHVHSANPVGIEWLEGMIERYKPS
jgi:hypothetical protein